MKEISYKLGDATSGGEVIAKIISGNSRCIVFFNEGGEICFEHSFENLENISVIINKYNHIAHQIPDGLPTEKLDNLTISLATALFNSLVHSDSHISSALTYLNEVEQAIKKIVSPYLAKLILIVSNIIITIIVVLCCAVIYDKQLSPYANAIVCIGAGAFGSLFSLLQRNSNIVIPLTKGYLYIILQSVFISVLGGMSGLIMYTLIKSGMAFSLFDGNIYGIVLLSTLSGFSERLVPDLFSSIERSNKNI